MKRILFNSLLLLAALLGACSEEDLIQFDGQVSGIYIQKDEGYNFDKFGNKLDKFYSDSTVVTFASAAADITEVTQYITVKLMGNTVDYDRPFNLYINADQSTALQGVHFDFDESQCVLKANTAITNVPVVLHRHPDLLTQELRAVFNIASNEHFTTETELYNNSNNWQARNDTLCSTRFRIIFSEILTRPDYWDLAEETMGLWSASKEKRVNNLMGWTHRQWINGGWTGGVQYGHIAYAAKLLRKDLQAAADAGTPVMDDNGQYMQLAPGYEVDYSAYE